MVLRKAIHRYRVNGLTSLLVGALNFLYNKTLRRISPRRIVNYNGVDVRAGYQIDLIVPFKGGDRPRYETEIVEGIRNHVQKGDSVIVVGGGLGVASVTAARRTGETGKVICYEGSKEQLVKVRDTLHLNDVSDLVQLRHALVGTDYAVWGEKGDPDLIAPQELPECDVLVMDCEGAERDILEETTIGPDIIIVETHAIYDAPKSVVSNLLDERGYDILSIRIADEHHRKKHKRLGIYVIVAKHH